MPSPTQEIIGRGCKDWSGRGWLVRALCMGALAVAIGHFLGPRVLALYPPWVGNLAAGAGAAILWGLITLIASLLKAPGRLLRERDAIIEAANARIRELEADRGLSPDVYVEQPLAYFPDDKRIAVPASVEVELGLCLTYSGAVAEGGRAYVRRRLTSENLLTEPWAEPPVLEKGNRAAVYFSNIDSLGANKDSLGFLVRYEVEIKEIASGGHLTRIEILRHDQVKEFGPPERPPGF
jgi:hypothetical protein